MENKNYTCNICNKLYKTYKSMWFHKYKHHKKENILTQNNSNPPHDNSNIPQNNSTIPQNNSTIPQISPLLNDIIIEDDNKTCKYCHKIYSRSDNLIRHMKKCKSKEDILREKEDIIKENEELKKNMKEMKESFEKFKKQMIDTMNQKYKMHPKTFQKMVNSNNINSNNNITINNIKYIEYGSEDLYNVFSKNEKLMLLKSSGSPIENIIKYTHLNEKYPQFQNIIITNVRSNQAYAYNEELNKFILCDKNELLEELIDFRYDDLIGFFDQYKELLSPKLKDTLERSFLLKNDKKFCKNKSKEFNVIIYNNCNKDNIKYSSIDNNDNNDNTTQSVIIIED
jgi:hypothetical protein